MDCILVLSLEARELIRDIRRARDWRGTIMEFLFISSERKILNKYFRKNIFISKRDMRSNFRLYTYEKFTEPDLLASHV